MGWISAIKTFERYDERVHIQAKNQLFKGQIEIKRKDQHKRIIEASEFLIQKQIR